MYSLYKITNLVNQKTYIGITKLTIQQRWKSHLNHSANPKCPIQWAIQKYGAENFSIEVLFESEDRQFISELEEPTIQQTRSRISENGYNVAVGGYGGDLGQEVNLRRRNTIRSRSFEEKTRLSNMQRQRQVGKTKVNDAGRRAQSEKVKGNKFASGLKHTDETKRKISESNKFKRSTETRHKMSKSAILNNNGSRFTGRRACCLCCQKEWDIGNYTQHLRRKQ